jgi:hypothetical protein
MEKTMESMFPRETDLQIGTEVKTIFSDKKCKIYDIQKIHFLKNDIIKYEFKIVKGNDISTWLQRSDIIFPI